MSRFYQTSRSNNEAFKLAELNIKVIRSKRKSISLQVKPEGIILRAPMFSPTVMLKAFALSKLEWLRKHHKQLQSKKINPKKYCHGEQWLFLGKPITLKVYQDRKSSIVYFEELNEVHISLGSRVKHQENFVKKILIEWYKEQAREYLQMKVPAVANEMGLSYQTIDVREYKARWGSCSSNGNLSFNWRIFMAPTPVIYSVIVHELAHLKHFNHSKQFWQLVKAHCPDYDERHSWLKQNQGLLQA